MNNSMSRLRSRVQGHDNAKVIQNYVYYPDLVLGTGNYSTVYEGISKLTKQKIAAKVISLTRYQDPQMIELLQQQIQTLLTLKHENIIQCYDVLKTTEQCYCFTELCQDGTLADKLKAVGTFTQQQAWPYIRDMYEALKFLNSKSIIHRDLKTANIFIKNGVAKLADFGFAVQSRISIKGLSIGSPVYMAPQGFIQGMYSLKTDIWAFGILIYELLHGRTPFSHLNDPASLTKALQQQLQQHDFSPFLSPQLKQLLRGCLEINQSKRYSIIDVQFSSYMQKNLKQKIVSNGAMQITRTCSTTYNDYLNRTKTASNILRIPYKRSENQLVNSSEKNTIGINNTINAHRPSTTTIYSSNNKQNYYSNNKIIYIGSSQTTDSRKLDTVTSVTDNYRLSVDYNYRKNQREGNQGKTENVSKVQSDSKNIRILQEKGNPQRSNNYLTGRVIKLKSSVKINCPEIQPMPAMTSPTSPKPIELKQSNPVGKTIYHPIILLTK